MLFTECEDYFAELSDTFDTTLQRIILFAEDAREGYEINCQEAELKVLKESGSDNDLIFLQEAAGSDYAQRIKKAIDKIVEALRKFIASVVEKVESVYLSAKAKLTIEKVEKAAKANPKLRSKKITLPDTDQEIGVINKALAEINKAITKIKAGSFSKKDHEALQKQLSDAEAKRKKIAIGATVTVAVTAAASLYFVWAKKLGKGGELSKAASKNADMCDKVNVNEVKEEYKETTEFIRQYVAENSTWTKKMLEAGRIRVGKIINGLKGLHEVQNPEVTHSKLFDESTDFDYDVDDMMEGVLESVSANMYSLDMDVFEEGVNIDSAKVLRDGAKSYKDTMKDAKALLKAKKYKEAKTKVAQGKKELEALIKEIDKLDAGNDALSTAIGIVISIVLISLKATLIILTGTALNCVAVLPLAAMKATGATVATASAIATGTSATASVSTLVSEINAIIATVQKIQKSTKAGKELSADDFNTFKTGCEGALKNLIKKLDKINKMIDDAEKAEKEAAKAAKTSVKKESTSLDLLLESTLYASLKEENNVEMDIDSFLESTIDSMFDSEELKKEEEVVEESVDEIDAVLNEMESILGM